MKYNYEVHYIRRGIIVKYVTWQDVCDDIDIYAQLYRLKYGCGVEPYVLYKIEDNGSTRCIWRENNLAR